MDLDVQPVEQAVARQDLVAKRWRLDLAAWTGKAFT